MPATASFFRLLGFSILIGGGLAAGVAPGAARAGEADDLQVMIDRARNGVPDLERQDERGATRDEASVLRMWLDEAWKLRSEQKYDEVRIVLDRCDAQAAMIREKIAAAKVTAQANERDQTLKRLRENIEKARRDIMKAITDKAALEARAKS
jgi:hypothetical protein